MTANVHILFQSLLTIALLTISSILPAKNYYVSGDVLDSFHHKPIPSMNVALLYPDSTMVSSGIVTERKEDDPPRTVFILPVKKEGKYILRFSLLGYQTTYADINVKFLKNSSTVDVGKFYISEQVYKIKETSVTATRIKMVIKGDTLIYNADAFQLAQGSMLDALIAQLPGVELKDDGRIFANGKFVEDLLLNGKQFFKGDPKVALENLPAYMVDKVKVYDKAGKMSEFMGKNMGDQRYVIDVHLKKQYSIGWIANAELGGGTNERYEGKIFGLRFTPNSQLSAFANLNNLNDDRRPGKNGDWRPSDISNGLQTTQVGGLLYNLEKNKWWIYTDNKIEHYDSDNQTHSANETFLPSGNVFSRSFNAFRNKRTVYTTNNFVSYQFQKYWINLAENIHFQNAENRSFSRMGIFSSDPSKLITDNVLDSLFAPDMGEAFRKIITNRRQQEEIDNSDFFSNYSNLGGSVNLGGSPLSIDGEFTYNRSKGQIFNRSELNYFSEPASDYRDQYFNQPSDRHRYKINMRYDHTFTNDTKMGGLLIMLAPYYTFDDDYKSSKSILYRLDQLPGWKEEEERHLLGSLPSTTDAMQTVIDQRNSYESQIHEISHDFKLRFCIWNLKKKNLKLSMETNFSASLLRQELEYHRNNTDYPLIRNSFLLNPDAMVTLSLKNNQKLEWKCKMQSQTPTLTYLLDIRDDSDPLNIALGNTDLKIRQKYSTRLFYSRSWKKTQTNLNSSVSFDYTQNATTMGLIYNRETGVRTRRPDNINGNYSIYGGINYSRAIGKQQRWSISSSTNTSYNHSVDLVGVEGATSCVRSTVNNLYLGEILKLDYRLGGKFSVGVKAGGSWTHATSEREDFRTINVGNFNYGLTGQVELPWNMQFSTDFTQYSRRGYEVSAMNSDELVWNARLAKSCMKGNLIFMLDGFDILGNLSNVRQTVNAQGRTESYSNVIPSYAMLRVVYRLNVQPKKKK